MTFKTGDLVEDNEGDKAVVLDAKVDNMGLEWIRITWDCTNKASDWIPASRFSNLSERVRELDGERSAELAALEEEANMRCDTCGRQSWATETRVGTSCGMPQPSGGPCEGHFVEQT
jgi:hypothetical protein